MNFYHIPVILIDDRISSLTFVARFGAASGIRFWNADSGCGSRKPKSCGMRIRNTVIKTREAGRISGVPKTRTVHVYVLKNHSSF
jgi:hypothetical protein